MFLLASGCILCIEYGERMEVVNIMYVSSACSVNGEKTGIVRIERQYIASL